MSELVERIAQTFCDTIYFDVTANEKMNMGRTLGRDILVAIREAPKSVLWAGALHATSPKDLEIWAAMCDEGSRE